MYKLTRQQSNFKLLSTEKIMNCFDSTTKLAKIGSAQGTGQVKYVGNTDVFYFGFCFMSPKWTRTKIVGLILSTACTGRLWIPKNIS